MKKENGKNSLSYGCYRVIRWLIKTVYPKIEIMGTEHIPEESCVLVGNHTQMHGPICVEMYIPGKRKIWCAWQMMHLKEVPAYAFQDFWSAKPRYTKWFYKLLSYLIAPLSVCIFNHAHTIAVYHDSRLLSTFKQTVAALQDDANVVIFPEHYVPHNHIVYQFQDKFIDIAKLYYKRTGKALAFVPMYVAPKLHRVYFGKAVTFCPETPIEEERQRICKYLMDEITQIAVNLPRHTVVPYANIPKKDYPQNIRTEEDEI